MENQCFPDTILRRPLSCTNKPVVRKGLNFKTAQNSGQHTPKSRAKLTLDEQTSQSLVTMESTTLMGKPSTSWSKLGSGNFCSKVDRCTPGKYDPLPYFVRSSVVKEQVKPRIVPTKRPTIPSSVFNSKIQKGLKIEINPEGGPGSYDFDRTPKEIPKQRIFKTQIASSTPKLQTIPLIEVLEHIKYKQPLFKQQNARQLTTETPELSPKKRVVSPKHSQKHSPTAKTYQLKEPSEISELRNKILVQNKLQGTISKSAQEILNLVPNTPKQKKCKLPRVKLVSIKDNGLGVASAIASSIPLPLRYTQPKDQLEKVYPLKEIHKKHIHSVISTGKLNHFFKSNTIRRSTQPFQGGTLKKEKIPGPAYYKVKKPQAQDPHHFNKDKKWI